MAYIMMKTKKSSPAFLTLMLVASTIALSACSGMSGKKPVVSDSMTPNLQTGSIDRAMERALADAEASGNTQEILAMLAQVNGRNAADAAVATRYANALREDDQINAAVRVLQPFVSSENKNVDAVTEMAMAQIALGDFEVAENYAKEAVSLDSKNARGFLALGTAQDALTKHQEAEISFRQGLKYWQGDPTPILNNLALNLASQGHLKESLSLLEKALEVSPGRMDLERNRRIIATLVETAAPMAPAPNAKPKDTIAPIDIPQNVKAKEVAKKEVAVEEKSVEEVIVEAPKPKSTLKNIGLKGNSSYN